MNTAERRQAGIERALGKSRDANKWPADAQKLAAERGGKVTPIGSGPVTAHTGIKLICAADVEPQSVEWLWPGRYPLGKIALLAGDPGIGKSLHSMFIASCISLGAKWPDGSGFAPIGETLILAAEDGVADTMVPRLMSYGADRSKIFIVSGVQSVDAEGKKLDRGVRFDTDIGMLRLVLEEHRDIKAVIIDPVSEYLGKVDSSKNEQVRSVMAPLAQLAEEFGTSLICITHMSKAGPGKAMFRSMGSVAFVAMSRVAWGFIRDRDDQDRVLVLPLKNNIGKRALGMAYRIVDGPRIEWEDDPVNISADEAMAEPDNQSKGGGGRCDTLKAWIVEQLAGGEILSDELKDAAIENGNAFRTFKRAKEDLTREGVIHSYKGMGNVGKWYVSLKQEVQSKKDGPLGLLGLVGPTTQTTIGGQGGQEVQQDHAGEDGPHDFDAF